MSETPKKYTVPPYVPHSTFTSFINGLKKAGLPSHIDRSLMTNMSGSGQSAMLAAIKSMGLVNSDSEPMPNLTIIVEGSEEEYVGAMQTVVKHTYPFLFDGSVDIENTTSKKVEDRFRLAGASGSTLTKTISFFLAAAKEAGIAVSSHVKAPKLVRSPAPKKNTGKAKNNVSEGEETPNIDPPPSKDLEKISFTLRGKPDVIVYFPKGMDDEEAKQVIKATIFNLKMYYGFQGEKLED